MCLFSYKEGTGGIFPLFTSVNPVLDSVPLFIIYLKTFKILVYMYKCLAACVYVHHALGDQKEDPDLLEQELLESCESPCV